MNAPNVNAAGPFSWKALLWGVVIGLIAGPSVLLAMGWVVRPGVMHDRIEAAVVRTEASICAARAREVEAKPYALDFKARRALAGRHAVMPGQKEATAGVMAACESLLGRRPRRS